MAAVVTPDQCKRAQDACAKAQAALIAQAVSEALQPLPRIEEKLEVIHEKLEGLPGLYDRVKDLELWKAGLEGRAAAVAEMPHLHQRDADATARLHARMESVLAASEAAVEAMNSRGTTTTTTTTETTGNGLPALPRWAVIGLAGFVLLVIALVATERQQEIMRNPPAVIGK